MKTVLRSVLGLAVLCSTVDCVSYSSIQKTDKEVYLSGGTSYWFITVPFLKRCDVDGQVLRCEELKEFEPSARRGGGEAAPAGSGSAAPAPAPAPAAAPKK